MKIDEKLKSIETKAFLLKPWFKIDRIAIELDGKSTKWVRDTFCKSATGNELRERKLIKKIGNEWHFKNPEFLNYIHDEWWDK